MVKHVRFPALNNANQDGLLTMGGDLSLDTLVSAYSQGIFPWFNEDQPILWWSPDPRLVFYPGKIKISRSLAKRIRQKHFRVTCNQAFEQVISGCALRGAQSPDVYLESTWITQDMHDAYLEMHHRAYAHSIEVWNANNLVGGLYGVALGKVFFGESMFSRENDASKVGLVALSQWLHQNDFAVIDCQVANEHLISLGAQEISRDNFLTMLQDLDINAPLLNFSHGFEHLDLSNVIKTP